MLPVTSLNNLEIGNGKPGNIFKQLLNAWSQKIGVNIQKQIVDWNYQDESSGVLDAPIYIGLKNRCLSDLVLCKGVYHPLLMGKFNLFLQKHGNKNLELRRTRNICNGVDIGC